MNDLKINSRGKIVEETEYDRIIEKMRREIQRQVDDEIFQALEDWASGNKVE